MTVRMRRLGLCGGGRHRWLERRVTGDVGSAWLVAVEQRGQLLGSERMIRRRPRASRSEDAWRPGGLAELQGPHHTAVKPNGFQHSVDLAELDELLAVAQAGERDAEHPRRALGAELGIERSMHDDDLWNRKQSAADPLNLALTGRNAVDGDDRWGGHDPQCPAARVACHQENPAISEP